MALVLTEREKKYSIIVAVVSVICAVLPGYLDTVAKQFVSEQEQRIRNVQVQIQELTDKLDGIEDERRVLLANQEDYIGWVEKGVVSSPDPVRWIKNLQKIQQDRNFFEIGYKFGTEREYPSDESFLTENSTVALNTSAVDIEMPMLHDLDLFMLLLSIGELDDLMFPVECDIDRITNDFKLENRPNLNAKCNFEWVYASDPEKAI